MNDKKEFLNEKKGDVNRTYYPDPEAALDAAMGLSSAGHLVALGRDGARPDWYVREIAPAEEA